MVEQHQVGQECLLPVRSGRMPMTAEESVLARQVEEYKMRGFTVLRDVLSADEVEILRERLDKRMEIKMVSHLSELEGKPAKCMLIGREQDTLLVSVGSEDSAIPACWPRRRKWPNRLLNLFCLVPVY